MKPMDSETGEYYLGLDIGTNSLGWAVTDTDYNILDYRRKAMWGIHLFEEGKTAAERRTHRCARRRLERRKQRIALLREILSAEIDKVDISFYNRLDESGLHMEDRNDKQPNSLFNDKGFTDKEFHARFPTIYHLRAYLMETEEKPDIRLVYLALHHIIKYRGHFLFSSISSQDMPELDEVMDLLVEDTSKYEMELNITDADRLKDALTDRSLRLTERKKSIFEALNCNTKSEKALGTLISGGSAKPSELFSDDTVEFGSISFSDSNIDDKMAELEDVLDEDQWNTIRLAKQVYDWSVLTSLLKGYTSISYAKIATFDQHSSDLRQLKESVRRFAPDRYKKMFKDGGVYGNYCSYSGVCGNGKPEKTCSQEDFCKYCKNMLSDTDIINCEDYKDMMERICDGSFMPKQTCKSNSVFPYTVHRTELVRILDNVSRFYPFLKEVGEDGFSAYDKILMIQKFRIPYYVGPLNPASDRSWVVRKSDTRVRPWNFEDVVDMEASAEAFMENLTSMCTYLVGEKVLPKNSILYTNFMLNNELNNLRVNGNRIPVDLKKRIIRDLFEDTTRKGRVTKNTIIRYLKSIGEIDNTSETEITGIDNEIKTTLRSFNQIKSIIGPKAEDRSLCENIIRIATVFEDGRDIKRKLTKDLGDVLSDAEIGRLSKLRFEGWGRLSQKFLTGIFCFCPEMGRDANILDILESTGYNLMEIIHRFGFDKQIEKINRTMVSDTEVTYDSVEKLYLSPAVKRGIWRTVCIVKDITERLGHAPKKVFVETTRQNTDPSKKKRSESRKAALVQLYKSCKEDEQWISDLESRDEAELKGRNMYLYYTQLGRCMYCGRRIDYEELNSTDSVDRDHIYPQSLIKDDSIHNNMVLSCKSCNSRKSNRYPIDPEVQMRMRPTWDVLLGKHYITPEKYSRLTRTEPFTDEELSKFISRQLVETSQSVKGAIDILGRLFGGDTEIVYVKAGLVSELRQFCDSPVMTKCRSVNDYHHAKDAYLNIVAGNVYDTKFTKDVRNFIGSGEHYNLARMYDDVVSRNGCTAWIPGENGTRATVLKYMRRNNILFTKQPFIKKGALFDDNLVRAKENAFERKIGLDTGKYGGYNKPTGACYSLVEYENKGKVIRSLEVVPVLMLNIIDDPESLCRYHSESLGHEVRVLIPVIRLNTLFEWDGFRMHLGGRTGDSILFYNAVQLLMDDERFSYCKTLFKFDEDYKNRVARTSQYYGITKESNLDLYDYLNHKTKSEPYKSVLSALGNNLDDGRDAFENLDALDQAITLNLVLLSFHCNNSVANLKKSIGGSTAAGRIVISKRLPAHGDGEVYVINQSPSGLIENRIRIN